MDSSEVRTIYNKAVKGSDYEHDRWFADDSLAAGYEMTRQAIRRYLLDKDIRFNDFLEVGSGAGTWTKFFCDKSPQFNFDLVDISSEMLNLAKNKLGGQNNIRYIESDFLAFETGKKYDLFFSCRALEYFSDKEKFCRKVYDLLREGGSGFIVTKTPKYFINRLLGRKVKEFHQGQISAANFEEILKKCGFTGIETYPVTMSFPLFRSSLLNKGLGRLFGGHELNFLNAFFSESYCVKFRK